MGSELRGRAERFARRLQSRLRSLGEPDTASWDSSDSEVFYDLESPPMSPEEEAVEPVYIATQNRECLPLQRSESESSQYFDTVESIEDYLPSPPGNVIPTKQIPILHLKTGTVITNGYTNIIDADSGCSRVHEMPSLQLTEIEDIIENNCCSHSSPENSYNREEKGVADISADLESCVMDSCEVTTVEVDTRQQEEKEDVDDNTESFCVFCDIEQIKSSLSSCSTENETSQDNINGQEISQESKDAYSSISDLGNLQFNNPISSENIEAKELVAEEEEGIPLSNLLQVLKQEIFQERSQGRDESKETETSDTSKEFPRIEVKESSPEKNFLTEEDEIYDIETKRKNFRRCSSLKSGKTPPGTPGRKKIVRFADVLGLDLADVKTFLDEVPTIPKSAYEDLHGIELSSSPVVETPLASFTVVMPQQEKILVPLFHQPSILPNFLDRVRENKVCLENAYVSDMALFAISGLVRVKNIDYHKSVYVRYSIDKWRSFSDLQARYVPNSCDGFSDSFSFVLYAHTLAVGQRMEFAVRFHAAGSQFWDSNGGQNYCFECKTQTSTTANIPTNQVETWGSFY